MSALVARRTLALTSKVGSEKVELQQLNGLQLFDYQAVLLSVDWPEVDEKAGQRAQQKTLLAIHRITYELNLLLAAMGLHYKHPELDIEQMKAWVLAHYPDSAHVLRMAMAVKEISGLASIAKADAEDAEKPEPVDPKKG